VIVTTDASDYRTLAEEWVVGPCENCPVTSRDTLARPPFAMAVFLLVTGIGGLFGAFKLVVDEYQLLEHPKQNLGCDVNPFISCSNVMNSPQAHLLGFPNPILGVTGFVAPIAVAVMMLAGLVAARWFWTAFNAGVFLAWVFVTWLFTQTVWFIGALCPWCMLVWAMTIPMFWIFTSWNLARGGLPFGERGRRIGAAVLPYAWLIVLANYAVIAVVILVKFPTVRTLLF
jgi:uncharacterized membrane protein